MARVIIPVRKTRFDVSAATCHGDPVYMFENEYDDANPMSGQAAMDRIEERLDEIGFCEDDVIVLTGPVALVSMVLAVAVSIQERVSVMIFDARTSSYRIRVLDQEAA